jgi:hypothetical protein
VIERIRVQGTYGPRAIMMDLSTGGELSKSRDE